MQARGCNTMVYKQENGKCVQAAGIKVADPVMIVSD
jgi:hypothetical protein